MDKRTTIILFTAFSVIIGPMIILGFLLRILGAVLSISGWLCWMEPRMAKREWKQLSDKMKRLWKDR